MEVKDGGRAGCENSQPVKFRKLRKFATLQNLCNGPFFFSLWLQFPYDFNHKLRVHLGFFMLELTRNFLPDQLTKTKKIATKHDQ